jgi:hypothetical protein
MFDMLPEIMQLPARNHSPVPRLRPLVLFQLSTPASNILDAKVEKCRLKSNPEEMLDVIQTYSDAFPPQERAPIRSPKLSCLPAVSTPQISRVCLSDFLYSLTPLRRPHA